MELCGARRRSWWTGFCPLLNARHKFIKFSEVYFLIKTFPWHETAKRGGNLSPYATPVYKRYTLPNNLSCPLVAPTVCLGSYRHWRACTYVCTMYVCTYVCIYVCM